MWALIMAVPAAHRSWILAHLFPFRGPLDPINPISGLPRLPWEWNSAHRSSAGGRPTTRNTLPSHSRKLWVMESLQAMSTSAPSDIPYKFKYPAMPHSEHTDITLIYSWDLKLSGSGYFWILIPTYDDPTFHLPSNFRLGRTHFSRSHLGGLGHCPSCTRQGH